MKARAAQNQVSFLNSETSPRQAFREVRNYLAGRFVGSTRDSALLEEVAKLLFCKLTAEIEGVDLLEDSSSDVDLAQRVRKNFAAVRERFPDIYLAGDEILLDPESIYFVLAACRFEMIDANSDPIGDAFEVFVGSEAQGREGQFFTPRSVTDLLVDLVAPSPNETVIDPACGAGGFLASTIRHHRAAGVSEGDLIGSAGRCFGIDKDEYLTRLARVHLALLSGGRPSISHGDSLALADAEGNALGGFPEAGFDVLLTNPPFGAKIVSASAETLATYDLARKWKVDSTSGRWVASKEIKNQVPPQVLFIERCLKLLRDGGRMGLVLPESLISNRSHRYVVQYLMDRAHILSVIGMPDALFKTSGKGGTHTKTCLVVAQKDETRERGSSKVFMAEAKWCGHDSRARKIPHNDLPTVAANFVNWQKGGRHEDSQLGFVMDEDAIHDHILCPHYYDPMIEQEEAELESTNEIYQISQLVADGVLSVTTGNELGKLAYGTGDIPFIRTSDISNWELKHDAKHSVSEEIYEKHRVKQDVQPDDILMVKDGTYLIGTCALVTSEDAPMLYQSHLFKIRVHDNELGITPHLLLALLSSPWVQRQVRAKRFTMDIIDSLGARLYELKIPVPKDEAKRNSIASLVEKSAAARSEARRLAYQARELASSS